MFQTEYKYCYDLVLHYVLHYLNKDMNEKKWESELRDELWFIEFGRGVALPLTPEEAPADGEPVVPCAQGRVVIESARPAQPHFATCSTYRRHLTHSNGTQINRGISASVDRSIPVRRIARREDYYRSPYKSLNTWNNINFFLIKNYRQYY